MYNKNPPGSSTFDADTNPGYPTDLIKPELTPANSIPDPTVFPTNTEPVIILSVPSKYVFSPVNTAPNATVSVSALLPLKSKYWNLYSKDLEKVRKSLEEFLEV